MISLQTTAENRGIFEKKMIFARMTGGEGCSQEEREIAAGQQISCGHGKKAEASLVGQKNAGKGNVSSANTISRVGRRCTIEGLGGKRRKAFKGEKKAKVLPDPQIAHPQQNRETTSRGNGNRQIARQDSARMVCEDARGIRGICVNTTKAGRPLEKKANPSERVNSEQGGDQGYWQKRRVARGGSSVGKEISKSIVRWRPVEKKPPASQQPVGKNSVKRAKRKGKRRHLRGVLDLARKV